MAGNAENLVLRGTLKGHSDWVTSLATTPEDPNLLLSSSRDKSVIAWQLTHSSSDDDSYGYARRALRGHSHFVSDVVISSDGAFALSASWDSELRLWDIASGKTTRRFVGHDKDVLSVAFSVDNRQIVSGTFVFHFFSGVGRKDWFCYSPPEAPYLYSHSLTHSLALFAAFSLSLSPTTTFLITSIKAPVMALSVCGTHSENANSPLVVMPKDIPNGCRASDSLPHNRCPSLYRRDGIVSSRFGI